MAIPFDEALSDNSRPACPKSAPGARTVLVCAVVLAAAAGFAAPAIFNAEAASVQRATELLTLIRFMAIVKAVMALGAAALIYWRLLRPAGAFMQSSYIASAALMAAGPGLIWNMTWIVAGAIVFHAGLLLFLVLAWADKTPALGGALNKAFRRRGRYS